MQDNDNDKEPTITISWTNTIISPNQGAFVEDEELTRRFAEAMRQSIDSQFFQNIFFPNGTRYEPQNPQNAEPFFPRTVSTKAEAAFRLLGIPITATVEQVRSAYRAAALRHHPDVGGDERQMKRINSAMEDLRAEGLA